MKSRNFVMFLSALLLAGAVCAQAVSPLTLETAIARALDTDAGLKAVGFERSSAEFRMKQAASNRYPVISLNAKARFIDELQSISTPLFSKEIGSKETYQFDATISMPVYTGGKIGSRIDMAGNQYRAVDMAWQAKRLEAAYRCRRAYFALLAAQAQREAVAASQKRIDVVTEDVTNLHAAGMADSLDVLETDLAREEIKLQIAAAETNRDNAAEALKKLIGEFDMHMQKLDTLFYPKAPHVAEADIAALMKRPELQQLAYLESAAQDAVSAIRAGYFPDISAFAGYSYGMPNQDMFDKSWNDYFSAGVLLSWSFNLGGQTRHTVGEAQAAVHRTVAERNDVEEALLLTARTALNKMQQAYNECEIVSREMHIAQRKYALAEEKRASGVLSVNRLLEIEAELTAVEKKSDAAIAAFYTAQAEFLFAIGSERLFGGVQ
ncbi:MAG: TolC family protein [Candidatus Zixiibacteriota bacterium]